jgi:hypothetical protein
VGTTWQNKIIFLFLAAVPGIRLISLKNEYRAKFVLGLSFFKKPGAGFRQRYLQ